MVTNTVICATPPESDRENSSRCQQDPTFSSLPTSDYAAVDDLCHILARVVMRLNANVQAEERASQDSAE